MSAAKKEEMKSVGVGLDQNAKAKALADVIGEIDKAFGKGTVLRMDPNQPIPKVPVVSTGSIAVDIAVGIGGLPKGRIVEIYGPESSGKTTLALQTIAQAQKLGGVCAVVDAEHAMDLNYARKLGVNTQNLLLSQPDCGEQALEITERLVRSGAIDVIVVDSVAALTPRAEIEGEMGDSHMGLQARMMSQAMRKLTAAINQTGTLVIFINQLRMKIGVMFGNPETTAGGNALKFYASVRLEVRRQKPVMDGEKAIGALATVKVVKNKMAPPFTKVETKILFGEGFSSEAEIIELATVCGALEKSGAWYSVKGEKIGQGAEQTRQYLKQNPDVMAGLRAQVLAAADSLNEKLQGAPDSVTPAAEEGEAVVEESRTGKKKNK